MQIIYQLYKKNPLLTLFGWWKEKQYHFNKDKAYV